MQDMEEAELAELERRSEELGRRIEELRRECEESRKQSEESRRRSEEIRRRSEECRRRLERIEEMSSNHDKDLLELDEAYDRCVTLLEEARRRLDAHLAAGEEASAQKGFE